MKILADAFDTRFLNAQTSSIFMLLQMVSHNKTLSQETLWN